MRRYITKQIRLLRKEMHNIIFMSCAFLDVVTSAHTTSSMIHKYQRLERPSEESLKLNILSLIQRHLLFKIILR